MFQVYRGWGGGSVTLIARYVISIVRSCVCRFVPLVSLPDPEHLRPHIKLIGALVKRVR